MSDYTLENFNEDIKTNREFEFNYNDKLYSLTYTKEGYIFTDICEQKDWVYKSYSDLLIYTEIEGKQIKEIIAEKLYDDLSIY